MTDTHDNDDEYNATQQPKNLLTRAVESAVVRGVLVFTVALTAYEWVGFETTVIYGLATLIFISGEIYEKRRD